MSLTAKDVAEITRLLEESDFDELHLELDGIKLSLRRTGAPTSAREPTLSVRPPDPASATSASHGRPAPGDTGATPTTTDAALPVVVAPLLGTFYRSPRPGAPPFVAVDSIVAPDTVVCIIEVMKLMNTVRAGVHGRIAEVVAHDGTLVEYGQPLFRVVAGGGP